MNKEELKKYYCPSCGILFDEPKCFLENRCPYGEKSNSTWIEHLKGCPNCEGGYDEVYLCEECGEYKEHVDYLPYAEEYVCDDCEEKMLETAKLANKGMEETINDKEFRGLPKEQLD